jgi:hypothetical protein
LDHNRAVSLIKKAIKKLDLSLKGATVLTEAGTGNFLYTGIIALISKAEHVIIWTKDTEYGKAKNIKKEFENIAEGLGYQNFHVRTNERPTKDITNSDIITNLGHIRPLDKLFLSQTKKNAVISLMCEKWELRTQDIDIDYCRNKQIKVSGTWENHPELKIFDNCGYLVAKLCFDFGFEIYQNDILVISNDKFGETIFKKLKKFEPNSIELKKITEIEEIRNKPELIIIADYTNKQQIIGDRGALSLKFLKDKYIIHLCGEIDFLFCKKNKISLYPKKNGHSFRMTKTLGYLGLKPVIDLHASGLKVGENMLNNIKSTINQPIVY